MTSSREQATKSVLYVLICLIWGSTWFAIKISLDYFPPYLSAALRFALASLAIYIVILINGYKIPFDKISRKVYLQMALLSFSIPFALIYWAEQHISSGLASVLFAVYPFSVTIFTVLWLKNETVGWQKIVGMVLAFAGIVVIFADGLFTSHQNYLVGVVGVLAAATMQAAVAVIIKRDAAHINPVVINFLPMLFSAILLAVMALLMEPFDNVNFGWEGIAAILYLAIFGSVVTFSSYYWLLKRVNIILLALIAFITPVIAVVLGVVFGNEEFTIRHTIGTILVLAGILSANLLSQLKRSEAS